MKYSCNTKPLFITLLIISSVLFIALSAYMTKRYGYQALNISVLFVLCIAEAIANMFAIMNFKYDASIILKILSIAISIIIFIAIIVLEKRVGKTISEGFNTWGRSHNLLS